MEERESNKAQFGKEPEMPGPSIKRLAPAQPEESVAGSAAIPAAPQLTVIAEHTVQSGETLSHLALKYYGSAVKDKWMLIYEANKDVIGDNPNRVRLGSVLKIPKLP